MQTSIKLTIGIPTFNRKGAVIARAQEFLNADIPDSISLLIVDNHSTDGTYEALCELIEGSARIKVLKNPENLGFHGNFFRLIEEVTSEYLLMNSDEDAVLYHNITDFLSFLEKGIRVFVSPQAVVDGVIYRGREETRRIAPAEFRASSSYLSGITFHVDTAKKLVANVQEVTSSNAMAFVYPQVLLVASLMIEHPLFWYAGVLTEKRLQLATEIKNLDGADYFSLIGRVSQYLGCQQFLTDVLYRNGAEAVVDEMKAATTSEFFQMVRRGVRASVGDAGLNSFDASGRAFYEKSIPVKNIARCLISRGLGRLKRIIATH